MFSSIYPGTVNVLKSMFKSDSIVWAAFRPGAIDTPGPGWVPAPHM